MAENTELRLASWPFATLHTYCRYLAVAIAAVPAGIVYAFLATHKLENWWTVLLTLVAGVTMAQLGWFVASHWLTYRDSIPLHDTPVADSFRPEAETSRDSSVQAVPLTGHWVFGFAAVLSWVILGVLLWRFFPVVSPISQ